MLRYLSVYRYLTKYILFLPCLLIVFLDVGFHFFVFAILEGSKTWNWIHLLLRNDLPIVSFSNSFAM